MKMAVKVLSQPDLSLFAAHQNLSKRRAIELNSDIFIDQFYPGLRDSYEKVIFSLVLIGPGAKPAHRLTRMVVRSLRAKSWHIKGEPIHDPDEEPGRYRTLMEGDFALILFEGHERPQAVTLILVSAAEDAPLHAAIADRFELLTRRTLIETSGAALDHLRATILTDGAGTQHPLDWLLSRDTIEDVLFGISAPAPANAAAFHHPVAVSPEDLRRHLLAATETGQHGEELFEAWLTATGHEEDDFTWASQSHARSAYDYAVHAARWLNGSPHVFVNVKTTRVQFERPIHLSIAELHFAARTENYRIARLYNIDGETPKLRILTGVQTVVSRIIERLDTLPDGVTADSLRLDPGLFEVELEAKLQASLRRCSPRP